jgi:hypothetical protein
MPPELVTIRTCQNLRLVFFFFGWLVGWFVCSTTVILVPFLRMRLECKKRETICYVYKKESSFIFIIAYYFSYYFDVFHLVFVSIVFNL